MSKLYHGMFFHLSGSFTPKSDDHNQNEKSVILTNKFHFWHSLQFFYVPLWKNREKRKKSYYFGIWGKLGAWGKTLKLCKVTISAAEVTVS